MVPLYSDDAILV